ncbi:hypothetical protein BaRGS_00007278 [Batillaria attramentaria]|uniref:Chitinase n=1 Tax=Batillaria attramentaria TaxID=370345 RepID=A0ABD0LR37_9CAEN
MYRVSGGYRRVCYYTNWSQYRPSSGKFVPENVDPTLCTHLIYTFAKLVGNQLKAFEWNDESTAWSTGMYERFQALKQKNPSVKTLLAVGGWNLASGPFTQMVATPQNRAEFAQSSVDFLRKWGFDGLDVDWEYPTLRGGHPQDRDHFTQLIREVRAKFQQEAATTGNSRLLLTAAVAAGKDKIDVAYDIPQLNQYLDFISIMTYDLHGSWETHTGHHTALYPRAAERGDDRYLNVDFAAKYWVQKGATPSKLNIGLATYGRGFTMVSSSQNGLGAATRSAANAGQYTREAGFLAYYEICQMQQRGGQRHNDAEQHVPYITDGDQWVGYEDVNSLREKVCYTKQNGYGGIMVWALDLDDFSGNMCGQGPYPLMHAINAELSNPSLANCPSPGPPPPSTVNYPWNPVTSTTIPPGGLIPQTPVPSQSFPNVQQGGGNSPSGGAMAPFPGVFFNTQKPTTQAQGPYRTQTPYPPTQSPYVPQTLYPTQQPVAFQTLAPATQPPFNPTFAVFWNTRTPSTASTQSTQQFVPVHPTQRIPQWTAPPPSGGVQTTVPSPVHPVTNPRGFNCAGMASDFYPNVYACDEYYICANQVSYRVKCAMGLRYNAATKHCDWPANTPCVSIHHATQPQAATQPPPVVQTRPPPIVQTQPPPVFTPYPSQTPPQVYTNGAPGQAHSPNTFCAGRSDGAYGVANDCHNYILCFNHLATAETCGQGLAFNQHLMLCQFPGLVPGCAQNQG